MQHCMFSNQILSTNLNKVHSVEIETTDFAAFCKIETDDDHHGSQLHLSLCAYKPKVTADKSFTTGDFELSVDNCQVKEVKKAKVSSTEVTVCCDGTFFDRKWTCNFEDEYLLKLQSEIDTELRNNCRHLLTTTVVSNDFVCNFQNSCLGLSTGIDYVVVNSVSNKDAYCFVSPSTEINVEGITNYNKDFGSKISQFYPSSHFERLVPFVKELNQGLIKFIPSCLLWGPRGCGNSSLVEATAEKTDARVVKICVSSLPVELTEFVTALNTYIGVIKMITNRKKCLLYIDAGDVFTNEASIMMDFKLKEINKFISETSQLFKGRLFIFMTARESGAPLNRCLSQKFVRMPPMEKRLDFLTDFIKNKINKDASKEFDENTLKVCSKLASELENYSWRDIHRHSVKLLFNKESEMNCEEFIDAFEKNVKKVPEVAMGKVRDIVGCEIKNELLNAVCMPNSHLDESYRMQISTPTAILLYGEPGCGKTSLVRLAVKMSGFTLFNVIASDVYTCYFGDSEKQLREIFSQARENAPSIVFIDEIDCFAGNRSLGGNSVEDRIATSLCTFMEEIGCSNNDYKLSTRRRIMVIAATNNIDLMDPAIKRRFDNRIEIKKPDFKGRLDILKYYISEMNISVDLDLEDLALRTEDFTGADLGNLVAQAKTQHMSSGKNNSCVGCHSFEEALALVTLSRD